MRKDTVTRRAFLKTLGVLGIAAPVISVAGCGGEKKASNNTSAGMVDAFKLSVRGLNACKACKAHARNKIFKTAVIADAHRAHAGCDCKIKLVRIPGAEASVYFAEYGYYDRRSAV